MFWLHKGHETGGEIFGPYDTPELAGEGAGRIIVKTFELEGNLAVGDRSFAVVEADTKDKAEAAVNAIIASRT